MPNPKIETVAGIQYSLPTVTVLQDSPLLVAELAGRIAYDSFSSSEHDVIQNFTPDRVGDLDADSSELLTSLAWVHHHHSVIEHLSLTYLIEGTSRGVLQELVRHRIASYTVRSTRYTMSGVINAFVASLEEPSPRVWFGQTIAKMDMFVTQGSYNLIESDTIWNKLYHQLHTLTHTTFHTLAIAKSSLDIIQDTRGADEQFKALQAGKKKRNVGDAFKHIITDNFKCDLVVTFNLRSLKNYYDLRASGAAYFQIQWLAEAMMKATPKKYLDLIVKPDKSAKVLQQT